MFTNWGAIRQGTSVKVFMGSGWERGTVYQVTKKSVSVQLPKRMVSVYDLRNVLPR